MGTAAQLRCILRAALADIKLCAERVSRRSWVARSCATARARALPARFYARHVYMHSVTPSTLLFILSELCAGYVARARSWLSETPESRCRLLEVRRRVMFFCMRIGEFSERLN